MNDPNPQPNCATCGHAAGIHDESRRPWPCQLRNPACACPGYQYPGYGNVAYPGKENPE